MRQIALLVVFVFGYSLILGQTDSLESTTAQMVSATVDPQLNDTSENTTSENSSTTNEVTTGTTDVHVTSSPIGPTAAPPKGPTLDPQGNDTTGNDTTGNNTTTSEGPSVNNTTGSPPTSSSLNTDPKTAKRVDEGQKFDAASFVGGIILAIGVVALGIFLFKVYQSRKGPRAEYNNI